jgi:hypothetical protein
MARTTPGSAYAVYFAGNGGSKTLAAPRLPQLVADPGLVPTRDPEANAASASVYRVYIQDLRIANWSDIYDRGSGGRE